MASILIQQSGPNKFCFELGLAIRTHKHGSALTPADSFMARVAQEFWTYSSRYPSTPHSTTVQRFYKDHAKLFLAQEGNVVTGCFAVVNGELCSLCSIDTDGAWLVRSAIEHGAHALDCFDGFLPKYYAQFGFREYRREPNHQAGGADIVYMHLGDV